jgi:hypothetical protein
MFKTYGDGSKAMKLPYDWWNQHQYPLVFFHSLLVKVAPIKDGDFPVRKLLPSGNLT